MHITEGYLPITHCAAWAGACALPVAWSFRRLDLGAMPQQRRLVVAAAAGFLFALTALKLPSVAGSSSHPTGIALGTILLGPAAMPVLALLVLVFQALLLAHGGLTTLGANLFSLGVIGPMVVWLVWKAAGAMRLSEPTSVVLATMAGSTGTYVAASLQLALAFPDDAGGVLASFGRFAGIFAATQIPVAVVEAFFTLALLRALHGATRRAVAS